MSSLAKIALTMGDPAGIGPELAVRAAADSELGKLAEIIIYGTPEIIEEAARRFAPGFSPEVVNTGSMRFEGLAIGKEAAACGRIAYDTVVSATKDALAGKVSAMVTAPMNKASVNLAGIPFTGHTELIAELCGVQNFAMMQSSGSLRVAFVTTHIPLREVSLHATLPRIIEVARLLRDAVRAEGIERPRLAAAAINPHAGENGFMGDEDEKIVKPALAQVRAEGIDIAGPFPPDTLFIEKIRTQFDGLLSMYHDQGHIPFKMLAFDSGVNSTLGLPIIRTSPDHGTAFNIAWQGKADTGSLFAAVRLAALRARGRG
ncbi:MAG: 4-hydroxythreonine-4-phosphate dehydrogenase PdxA [Lentisphaerae bacterium GWF2_52_8]|nr:MAG: 4-hydroxythreonine-4-phosphate dehydrogenase PdxA [Lentisphaerae bacterium GWF2_52_8]